MSGKLKLVLPLVAVTFGFAAVAAWVGHYYPLDLPPEESDFLFDPGVIGLAIQEQLLPVALVCWLASTPKFRRALDKTTVPPGLVPGFVGIMAISMLVRVGIQTSYDMEATFGAFPLIVGAVFGGRTVGLALGLYGYVLGGAGYILSHPRGAATIAEFLAESFLLDFATVALIWIGFSAGTLGDLYGERRLKLRSLLEVGLFCQIGFLAMITVADQDLSFFTIVGLGDLVVTCLSMAVVYLALRSGQKELEEEKARLADLASLKAQLIALRAQINPHFLFNSLNTIRYFVRTDPKAARGLLLDLSDVLKSAMASKDLVPLEQELELVEAYLNLEKARLGDRLQTEIEVEAGLAHLEVPALFLQPLVENSVKHGISSKVDGGTIQLKASREGPIVMIELCDDGPGFGAETAHNGHGIGLENVSRRLEGHYGEQARLEVLSPEQGAHIRITLPLERSD